MIRDEASAFDSRAAERVAHGHVPDLRRLEPCDWFFNNVWRRPFLADFVFGRNLRFALAHLHGPRVLEVGCGLGHMTLEFARNGFETTGIDVSPESIEIARRFAAEDPSVRRGSVRYVAGDFLSWDAPAAFDSVCFFGALHHFEDVETVLDRVRHLLVPGGAVIVIEPAREAVRPADAAVAALIRILLSLGGGWYENIPLPDGEAAWQARVGAVLEEYREARDANEREQSPHDNSATGAQMLAALRARFEQSVSRPGHALFPRLGGGVRGRDEADAQRLAEFIHVFDDFAVASGLLNAAEFLWAGHRR